MSDVLKVYADARLRVDKNNLHWNDFAHRPISANFTTMVSEIVNVTTTDLTLNIASMAPARNLILTPSRDVKVTINSATGIRVKQNGAMFINSGSFTTLKVKTVSATNAVVQYTVTN